MRFYRFFAALILWLSPGLTGGSSFVCAKTLLVEGGADDMAAVVHSTFQGGRDVVLFTDDITDHSLLWPSSNTPQSPAGRKARGMEQGRKTPAIPLGSPRGASFSDGDSAVGVDGVLLKGGAIDEAAAGISSLKEIILSSLRENEIIRIRTPKTSTYEIYLRTEKLRFPEDAVFTVSVNGKTSFVLTQESVLSARRRCLKMGEAVVPGGKDIEVKIVSCGRRKKIDAFGEMHLIVTDKDVRLRTEEWLVKKTSNPAGPTGYLLTAPRGSFAVPASWNSSGQKSAVGLELKIMLAPKKMAEKSTSQEEKQSEGGADLGRSPIFQIDETVVRMEDFEGWQQKTADPRKKVLLEKTVFFQHGKEKHDYDMPENPAYEIGWVLLESSFQQDEVRGAGPPHIFFQRVNPSKILVRVRGAVSPFWLVFNEAFHAKWILLKPLPEDAHSFLSILEKPLARYPRLGVEEGRHAIRFTPADVAYLGTAPLAAPHLTVNGFVNGWYISPRRLGLGRDFDMVLFFQPQAYFYLGLLVAAVTVVSAGLIFLFLHLCRNRKSR